MPLYKKENITPSTQILIWKIEESFDELFHETILQKNSLDRLRTMKSEIHRRAFLSVRKLLELAGYTDFDLNYDVFGKPYLNDKKHISITHSHYFSGIIISDKYVGIDIELQREKIINISSRFAIRETSFLDASETDNYIKKLTIIWGAKESVFKIKNATGISFNNHIFVTPFLMETQKTTAILNFENVEEFFSIYFETIEDFVLVYSYPDY